MPVKTSVRALHLVTDHLHRRLRRDLPPRQGLDLLWGEAVFMVRSSFLCEGIHTGTPNKG